MSNTGSKSVSIRFTTTEYEALQRLVREYSFKNDTTISLNSYVKLMLGVLEDEPAK